MKPTEGSSACEAYRCGQPATVTDAQGNQWCRWCAEDIRRDVGNAMQMIDFAKGLERRMGERN